MKANQRSSQWRLRKISKRSYKMAILARPIGVWASKGCNFVLLVGVAKEGISSLTPPLWPLCPLLWSLRGLWSCCSCLNAFPAPSTSLASTALPLLRAPLPPRLAREAAAAATAAAAADAALSQAASKASSWAEDKRRGAEASLACIAALCHRSSR